MGLSSHLQGGLGRGCRTSRSSLVGSPTPHSTPFPWLGAVTPPVVCPTLCLSSRNGKLFQVLLGAHSLTEPEPHKRLYQVRAQFPHPGSNIHNNKDDLLLLQVGWRLMGPSSPPGTAPFLQIPLSLETLQGH